MIKTPNLVIVALVILGFSLPVDELRSQGVVKELQEPVQPSLSEELMEYPDGVLRIKSDENGQFQSLVVKATVEIEDVLGATKGKQLARRESEIRCKASLITWLEQNCEFTENRDEKIVITTKGENTTDAAGNKVKLTASQGSETKTLTESFSSVSQALLRGLVVLHSGVTGGNEQEYVLIMGLSQTTLDSSSDVSRALSGNTGANNAGSKKGPVNDGVAPSSKTNPLINSF